MRPAFSLVSVVSPANSVSFHFKLFFFHEQTHVKDGDIDQWRKRVEMASEFAVSEVFPHKKPPSGTNNQSVPLQSSEQLRDHDDAYSEAQALLGDWLSSKLRLELEMEEDEEDDLMCFAERRSPVLLSAQPAALNYSNFDDLYNCLAEEEEHSAASSFLQDLMEQEVLDSGLMEQLALDIGQTRKKFRNPIVSMEARHLQVRENRARREAERERQQREREAQRVAREEAKRREQEEEMRRRQKARRQEEMVQQEMVRLRRQMEERRSLEQLARQRERERVEGQRAARSLQAAPPPLTKQQQQDKEQLYKEQKIQTKVHLHNLKCLQTHFSRWYSVVLGRRLRLGKAMALCDWKRQLRAWRAWRAVVWAEQRQREVARTEEDLRAENRQCQLALESDRRRLLRRCLNEWQLWCQMEKEQRELLAQQQETRRKMAALINAASTGKLKATETPTYQPIMAPPEASNQPETMEKEVHHMSGTLAPDASAAHQNKIPVGTIAQPTQPWQVTRRHAATTAADLHEARRRGENVGFTLSKRMRSPGGRFENRHIVQQQIITQQRKLLKEQQEQIARLREEQSMVGLELEMERTAQLARLPLKGHNSAPKEQKAPRVTGEADSLYTPPRKTVTHQTCPHPITMAMEARARQRAERRKEIEELKKRKEEEKLAEMKAAEEQRQREEEEEKRKEAQKKKEEKRQKREREEEKQRQVKRQQELLKLARQHYHRNLLLWRGLTPWKCLIELRQANVQLKDWRMIQEERAARFHRAHTLRRFLLALLDHVTQERLVEWDRQELAQEHNNRRVLRRCFLAWRQLPCLLRLQREKEGNSIGVVTQWYQSSQNAAKQQRAGKVLSE
ncbi:hypothetical protein L3Q82_004623 [Scortum barcoo]|uniref:Uncharacterized protein n=1 Tax=Scortum barcoo TaxID=214431 RepID=A0ACB8VIU9_9TELE|nr:hypothetical protein L3Q82_004623 [Scortum barcoo]